MARTGVRDSIPRRYKSWFDGMVAWHDDFYGVWGLSEHAGLCGSATGVEGTVQMNPEVDPNGLTLKTPGAKADLGKSPVVRGGLHYFPRAISSIAELSGIGAKKYSWKGWENVPDGIIRYGDAMGRHELRIEDDYSRRDPDTGVLEACAVAWNACARLELILRKMEQDE